MMTDEEQKRIFSNNLNRYILKSGKQQKEVAEAIGANTSTFNMWCKGNSMPGTGKIRALADYFRIGMSDLILNSEMWLQKSSSQTLVSKELFLNTIICHPIKKICCVIFLKNLFFKMQGRELSSCPFFVICSFYAPINKLYYWFIMYFLYHFNNLFLIIHKNPPCLKTIACSKVYVRTVGNMHSNIYFYHIFRKSNETGHMN